jgi:hypothetical protein
VGGDRVDISAVPMKRRRVVDDNKIEGEGWSVNVADCENGTYEVTYQLLTAGEYRLEVKFGGHEIEGSPFPLTVFSSELCADTR